MGLSADDPRVGRVAFAKLQGEGLEYFVRKYEVLLGRKSKSTELDIVLGDNMNISRQHAKIAYNFQLGVFELTVMGKNGVTVNGVLHTPSSAPQPLYTQDFLQVGEQKFFFLLPKGTTRRRPPSASPPAKQAGQAELEQQGPPSEAPDAEEDARHDTQAGQAQLSVSVNHPDTQIVSVQPHSDVLTLEQRSSFAAEAPTSMQQQEQQRFTGNDNAFQRPAAEAGPQQFANPPV